MSEDTKIIGLLNSQPFFEGMPEKYFPMIADCAELQTFSEGDYLIQQSQSAQKFYIILEGHVSLRTNLPPQGVISVETVTATSALGWSWLVAPYKWHYDAVTLSETKKPSLCTRRVY